MNDLKLMQIINQFDPQVKKLLQQLADHFENKELSKENKDLILISLIETISFNLGALFFAAEEVGMENKALKDYVDSKIVEGKKATELAKSKKLESELPVKINTLSTKLPGAKLS